MRNLVDFVNEAKKDTSLNKIMKLTKTFTGPYTILAFSSDNKLIEQDINVYRELVPASYNVMKEKYPKARIEVESSEGKLLK